MASLNNHLNTKAHSLMVPWFDAGTPAHRAYIRKQLRRWAKDRRKRGQPVTAALRRAHRVKLLRGKRARRRGSR